MESVCGASPSGFCRDCLKEASGNERRCLECGSPRLLRHDELATLSIAHIDCDAFYASVEKRDNPDIRDKPVIIGGGKRGVVSTACYLARIHGVRSAMPMFMALQACPQAIVIKPDMEKYARVGREVRQLMLELTPLVEPLSIDEAFLDLSGTERLHHAAPAYSLARFAKRVETEIGITVSAGLSYCKFLAKIASDMEKPRGFSVIGQKEAVGYLAALPVSKIWGVGKAFEETLSKDGITMIGQLQTMDEANLMRRYGTMGQRLARLARGVDTRKVDPTSEMKSVSAETTFYEDLGALSDLRPILRSLSEKVARRMKKYGVAGMTVALKLKTSDFKTRSRNKTLADPTQLADRIFRTGLAMLERETDGTKFRLIGIGVSELCEPDQADPVDLVDPQAAKRAKAEGAMDVLRDKFGKSALQTGETFGRRNRD
ncbi:MAG: DNA polymerase IV [Rhizobiaceae bacterium]